MQKLAIFTMGTRGDVQPYIFLGQALSQAGFEVVLGSHPCWQTLVESQGLSFAPIGPDIDIEEEAAQIRGKTKHPAISMLRTMNFVFRIIQNSSGDIYQVCKGRQLIIVSHSQMGAAEAQALNIPFINVTLQTEMIPEKLRPKKWSEKLVERLIGMQMTKPYNKIRKIYNLPKLKSADEMMSKELNLIPISKHVMERNPYWDKQHILTGYWYAEAEEFCPPAALKTFLESGARPIILALGAMSFESQQEEEKLTLFVEAFTKTGKRAVIQGFQKTLVDFQLPKNMMAVGSIPHSWLFRQGNCVIHHAGFGTAAATLIYGIPSIPIPHVLDQFGTAKTLHKIGVAVAPIQAKELSTSRLVEAIEEMDKTYAEKSKKVTELSGKIQAEDGLNVSVTLIKAVLEKIN